MDGSTTDRGGTTNRADEPEAAFGDEEEREIRKVTIDQSTYRNKYNDLIDSYWKCQNEVSEQYNFGLVTLDCRKFKKEVITKYEKLIEEFKKSLLDDFENALDAKWKKNGEMKDKVNADHGDDIEKNIG
jgi:hypothetical protein